MDCKESSKHFPYLLVSLLCINTLLLFGIYSYFVMRLGINWIFWLYYGALAASSLAYVIVNRAFVLDKLSVSTLPPDWSVEKKEKFLFARDERKRKSKWLLTVIFPLCLTVFFDVIYLFFGDTIINTFKTVTDFLGGR